jgi:AcrR family transcriptional regulator
MMTMAQHTHPATTQGGHPDAEAGSPDPGDGTRASGRPRDPDTERSILTATQDLLVESGYPGTTIAAVASRARCSKAAIYRRWTTKTDLVIAAVRALQIPVTMPDTGALRSDLLEAAMHFADDDSRAGAVLASLLGELGRDADLREAAYRTIGGPPVAVLVAVIERWIARGAIPADVPVDLIANIIPTAAFGSVTLRRRALPATTITDLIDAVLLPALRPGSADPS